MRQQQSRAQRDQIKFQQLQQEAELKSQDAQRRAKLADARAEHDLSVLRLAQQEAQQKAQVEGASAAYTSPAVTHALTALDEQIVTSAPASSAASRFNPFKKKKLNPTPLASIAAKTAVAQDATSSLVTAPAPAPPLAGEFPPPPAAVPSRVQRFK
ncbi:Oidioi.mRNA.OKI2018_I69.chr1.g48.t1.cds [Oikopleura dioica]|uniref:Oidioi.mRNA.OKI2018_I69.chr1.g48.t1.cds n=1 Tax=Oikopleura dioica TaxID=34765 RepID=A0ABN7SIL7_OIKDI|nr:Oidioi.mRNA.OKI2018_I69.chr1.g48.t1.cds [Oikopleura dioica]